MPERREEPPDFWPNDEVVQKMVKQGYLRPDRKREDFLDLWHRGLIDVATDRSGLAKYDTVLHTFKPRQKRVVW